MSSKPSAGRVVYLDVLRLLCSFLVIVNHTYDYVRLSEASALTRLAAFSSMSFAKIAVPIFLMISGCTLLTKEDDLKKTCSRILRVGLALIVFSFVYEVYRFAEGQLPSLSIKRFLLSIYEQHTTTAFWYLYAYLGLLLSLPFLQKLAHALHTRDFLLYFGISFFFSGFWPLVVEYTSMSAYNEQFTLPLFGSMMSYMLLGYFLYTRPVKHLPSALYIAVPAASALLCGFVTSRAYVATGGMRYLFLDNISLLPTIVSTICIFCLFMRLSLPERAARCVKKLGAASFGVYLMADLFIQLLFPLCAFLRTQMPAFAAVMLYQIAVWLVSISCALIMRRIPLLNKLL